MANIERLMSPEEIADLYGGNWGEHPRYPLSDWQHEAAEDYTRLGYWSWVRSKLDEDD
jgi:hypothetical protein